MTLTEIASIAASSPGWIAAILLVGSGLIEIAPIKWNPWKTIGKWIGHAINSDVMKELESVKQAQAEIAKKLNDRVQVEDERNADAQREKILHFNVELMRNLPHTREDYIEIMATMDAYEEYCREHPNYKNNRAIHAIANIGRVYDERQKKNDFYKADGGVTGAYRNETGKALCFSDGKAEKCCQKAAEETVME